MKNIYCIYQFLSVCILFATSCVNPIDDICELPIAGIWAKVEADGSVPEYIEFRNGRYSKSIANDKYYYFNQTLWNTDGSEYVFISSPEYYFVREGKLHLNSLKYEIAVYDGILNLFGTSYCYVKTFDSSYGFALKHDIELQNGVVVYSPASHKIVWTYDIPNLPKGYKLDIQVSADWLKVTRITDSTICLQMDENTLFGSRVATVVLSHPAIEKCQFVLKQDSSGLTLYEDKTMVDYGGGNFGFSYSLINPLESLHLQVSCDAAWITDLAFANGKVSFAVQENNSGSSRVADIVLKYGATEIKHRVEQSYLASDVLCDQSYTSCDYKRLSESFDYTLINPRESYELQVSCDATWITDLTFGNGKVSFIVQENNSGSSRVADIVLKYGVAETKYRVEQSYIAPVVSCTPSSITCNYTASGQSFTYVITNPRNDYELQVSCDAAWITNLSFDNGKVFLNVLENNSGSSRTAEIVLKYGVAETKYRVEQSYIAPVVSCTPSSITCNYTASGQSFTYVITNPRNDYELQLSCDATWITNLSCGNGKVYFAVCENNSSSTRTSDIVLKYGESELKYRVVQTAPPSLGEFANCYIIPTSGTYMFKVVKGNSSTLVGAVTSAEVLWESFGTSITPNVGDLIKSVSYSDDYIVFQTADIFKEGNAVIAAKDANDMILWSWHIWLTDQPQGQVYYLYAGTMMDRNLGATSAEPGDVGALGLLYQWGRKDPFLGSSSVSSTIVAKSTIAWPSAVMSNSSTGTIDYATSNPTTFVRCNYSNYDWYYTDSSTTDNTRWGTYSKSKSIYDPCPAGWRVPKGNEWSQTNGASLDFFLSSLGINKGIDFSGKFGDSSTIWYPAAGSYSLGDSLDGVGIYGCYWSASTSNYYANRLGFGSNDYGFGSNFGCHRASGQSVRCVKE